MREFMAYELVLQEVGKGSTRAIRASEKEDVKSRAKQKGESLRTSICTAYRWVFHPEADGLQSVGLAVPATRDERIAKRVYERLSDQNYGHPKILDKMGAVYFDSKLAPHLWKDERE